MFSFGGEKIDTDEKKIDGVLSRGVEEVVDKEDLKKEMCSGKQLRVKLGVDPTSPNLHVGRAVLLRKLKDFQDLGHQVVFIIGDSTGVIGDTSDKESERPMLTRDDVKKNAESYFEQAGKVLDMKRVEKHYNSEWLHKLSYEEIGEHADQFSVAEFIGRDNIRKRLKEGKRVSLREVLYPLMQGYDSVAIKADVELGGTDQRFNLLAGRVLQARYKQKPQNIVMMGLIEGLDGRKMSSSWGNVIKLTDAPDDMYGKVMSIHDTLMEKYFITSTRVPLDDVKEILTGHPRDAKMRLAREIVTLYHNKELAEEAEGRFVRTFQKRETPENLEIVQAAKGSLFVDVLREAGVVASNAEFRRLVEGGAVKDLDTDAVVEDTKALAIEHTFKIGKRRFIKIEMQ